MGKKTNSRFVASISCNLWCDCTRKETAKVTFNEETAERSENDGMVTNNKPHEAKQEPEVLPPKNWAFDCLEFFEQNFESSIEAEACPTLKQFKLASRL